MIQGRDDSGGFAKVTRIKRNEKYLSVNPLLLFFIRKKGVFFLLCFFLRCVALGTAAPSGVKTGNPDETCGKKTKARPKVLAFVEGGTRKEGAGEMGEE